MRRSNMSAALPNEAQPRGPKPAFEGADSQTAVQRAASGAHRDAQTEAGADAVERVLVAAGLDGDRNRLRQVMTVQNLLDAAARVGCRVAQHQRKLHDPLQI